MQKIKIFLVFFFFPAVCLATDIDAIKADFLRGNYRRVIFEGSHQLNMQKSPAADELNYLLGLSYLKEEKFEEAREVFSRISTDKLKAKAKLGITDAFLLEGKFAQAEEEYLKMLDQDSGSKLKPSILYRLSQMELKKRNFEKAKEYSSKLRKDYPSAPELRAGKELPIRNYAGSYASGQEYSVQIGFFSSDSNAEKLKQKLLAKNFDAFIEKSDGGYRVKVGKVKTLKEASKLEDELVKEGYSCKITQ